MTMKAIPVYVTARRHDEAVYVDEIASGLFPIDKP